MKPVLYIVSGIFAVFAITYFVRANYSLAITLAIMTILLLRFTKSRYVIEAENQQRGQNSSQISKEDDEEGKEGE
ncbi:hypothetical protein [Natranaerobius thermophilus]|uniref:Uncharacterized protein n=1 Tax=Natranaerobius thermophilus (strain ATCC BAA-1301 / DSM 18059 / JW/NM-WN-LF) TaxID=457570 RepID=B2A2Q8_NATTJ|nr:hypothetical protein [Natranaerobius thermophilus]ACB86276.1 hypothetical protein Nther_2724 [Natranaerobius thermophilus JW/NM-WN-LF]